MWDPHVSTGFNTKSGSNDLDDFEVESCMKWSHGLDELGAPGPLFYGKSPGENDQWQPLVTEIG